jgi:hypothetical protein
LIINNLIEKSRPQTGAGLAEIPGNPIHHRSFSAWRSKISMKNRDEAGFIVYLKAYRVLSNQWVE